MVNGLVIGKQIFTHVTVIKLNLYYLDGILGRVFDLRWKYKHDQTLKNIEFFNQIFENLAVFCVGFNCEFFIFYSDSLSLKSMHKFTFFIPFVLIIFLSLIPTSNYF